MPATLENSALATGLEKVNFHSNPKERQCQSIQTTAQLHSSHMLAKLFSKFSNPGINSTWNMNFQMFKLDLEKAEEPEIKLATFTRSSKKRESSRKTSPSALLTMPNSFGVSHQNFPASLENSSRDRTSRPPDLPPEKSVCRSGSNS